MVGVAMNVPRNVLWFEVLLYASLVLDALTVAFQDRSQNADVIVTLLDAVLILLSFFFVWLAARRRKSWPRWVLFAALVLSVISLFQLVSENGLELDTATEIMSCAVTAAGLYFSFTGDAKGWFNA
jgi:hypothetical protein